VGQIAASFIGATTWIGLVQKIIREILMPAKKTAVGTKASAAKKSSAVKAAPATKPTARRTVKKAATAKKRVTKKTAPAKAAAAKAAAKPTAAATFDADKRRKLIAAAAARRRKAVASKRNAPKPDIIQHREPTPVEKHKYSVGEGVRVISTAGMWFKNGIDYKVTAALPPAAGKLQYRIKNEGEPFERVVSESQLSPV
jgi:hypothetical protein